MNDKTQIFSLKSIKIGFDIVFILLIILVFAFLAISIFDITYLSPKSSYGVIFAEVTPNQVITTKEFQVISKIDKIETKSITQGYNIIISMSYSKFKTLPILYRVVYMFALTLSLLFITFIVFHIRNILKSIIKGIKEERSNSYKHFIFNGQNINRFRYIAYAFIIMPLIELFIYLFDSYFLNKYFFVSNHYIKPISKLSLISWDYIFIGFIFIAVIEILKRGIKIQEENDLTV